MSRVYFYSDLFLPTFPYLDIKLYNEVKTSGISAFYILNENDYRLKNEVLNKTYNTIATKIKKDKDIIGMVGKDDLLVMRFCYKGVGGEVATKARANGVKILMLDPAAVDLKHRECSAQYITAKSQWMKERVAKKFPRRYKDVFVTGTIHFDDAATTIVDKKAFMESYGLDPNKKLAIICKASPGEVGHQKGVDNEYKDIVKIIKERCADYEFLFKAHPLDYTSEITSTPGGIIKKGEHYSNNPSYKVIFSGFSVGKEVVRPDEGYAAIKACDIVVNVRSSIAMETPLFPVPIVNVNRHKYLTNWPFDKSVMYDIAIEELENFLNNKSYVVGLDAAKQYCKTYNYSDDGKAYARTAGVIGKLIK